jgi:thymidine phosphorylase
VFDPGNVDQCVQLIKKAESLKIDKEKIDFFIKEYNREKIMQKMAAHILSLV